MTPARQWVVRALLVAALSSGCSPSAREDASPTGVNSAAPPDRAQVERGRALALLGNCAGCHSLRDGAPYAGGPPLRTPFGTVFAGNLTPDARSGLGSWSADDFWQALHTGRGRDGRALVPAFPYTSFTHVTRTDSDDLFAYLRSLAPVARANRPHELRFPYGSRLALAAWQWLFFAPADLQAEAEARRAMPPRAARGAYLVDGLGHCAACHAPRNFFGAPAREARGGEMPGQPWYAPSLHPVEGRPVDAAQIVALLKTGQSATGTVLGPMAGVVFQSTQHWPDADLQAVAEHLATLPVEPARDAGERAAPATLAMGQRLYDDRCADCHGAQGEGVPGAYPALAGNATVLQPNARNLVQVLRFGGFAPSTATHPRPYGMPPQALSDAQAAAVLALVRQSWGNRAGAVTELEVLKLR